MIRRALIALILLPFAARAEPVQARYAAYAAGLNVINLDAGFDITPSAYRVQIVYRTAGTFGFMVRGQQDTTVQGQFVADRAVPQRFYSAGVMRGQQRLTVIDYAGGQPIVRQLVPPTGNEREPVPAELQRGTIDTLSAMAQLLRQVNDSRLCEGRVMTFDGRRLAELSAHTVGEEFLPPTRLSSYTGNALHCEFEGRQFGGFMLDEDRERLQRPQRGDAWFAAITPGGPLIPVRISFRTRWFGNATMFITDGRE